MAIILEWEPKKFLIVARCSFCPDCSVPFSPCVPWFMGLEVRPQELKEQEDRDILCCLSITASHQSVPPSATLTGQPAAHAASNHLLRPVNLHYWILTETYDSSGLCEIAFVILHWAHKKVYEMLSSTACTILCDGSVSRQTLSVNLVDMISHFSSG